MWPIGADVRQHCIYAILAAEDEPPDRLMIGSLSTGPNLVEGRERISDAQQRREALHRTPSNFETLASRETVKFESRWRGLALAGWPSCRQGFRIARILVQINSDLPLAHQRRRIMECRFR